MSSAIYPIATSSTGPNSWAFTCAAALTTYKPSQAFSAGVYTMTTSPNTTQVTATFYDGTSIMYETTTISGTITFNLGTAATGVYLKTDSGTDVVVSIGLTSNSLSGTSLSGTLDTITTTSTYNQTGQLYVLAFGGGGSGGCGSNNDGNGGGGGNGSNPSGKILYTNTAISITIGAQGAASSGQGVGLAGGTTSFGNLVTSSGGNGGVTRTNNRNGSAIPANHLSVQAGTNGNGGSGSGGSYGGAGNGGGSGVGTGGNGGTGNGAGNAATGYGAGGGGGGQQNPGGNSGAGSPGVVYVLRGF
jgi:hypothetical protein